jgi:hypothetical protein
MPKLTSAQMWAEFFSSVVNFIDETAETWRQRKIEVSKSVQTPYEVVWAIKWEGQPVNALCACLVQADGERLPFIEVSCNERTVVISDLPRNRKSLPKKAKIDLARLLETFLFVTLTEEGRRIALRKGFFATITCGIIYLSFGGQLLNFLYLTEENAWRLTYGCAPHIIQRIYDCLDIHPLEYFDRLLDAIPLEIFL